MTTIDHLPSELLLQILRQVTHQYSLRECIYVPKNWQSPATQANYEEVTLTAFLIYKIKALFEDKLLNQDDYFKQLYWTKKLKIAHDGMGFSGKPF